MNYVDPKIRDGIGNYTWYATDGTGVGSLESGGEPLPKGDTSSP